MFLGRIKRLLALLILLALCFALLLVQRRLRPVQTAKPETPTALISPELLSQFTSIETREQQADETTWAAERRAEAFGAVFEQLWDDFNLATNRYSVLAAFPVGALAVSTYGESQMISHQIQLA